MIRKFEPNDTTKVMTIWTKGNFTAHSFIEKDYWLENFNRVKNDYLLKADTYVYVENNEIKGFVSLLKNGYIGALFVSQDFKRRGIGKQLINHCKDINSKLVLKVYERNINALLFCISMGFKNKKIQIDNNTGEKEYIMEWDESAKEAKY